MLRGISCPYLRHSRYCQRASDLQPVLLQRRSPKEIPAQERLRGAGAMGGGEELPSKLPVLGKGGGPQTKPFGEEVCVGANLAELLVEVSWSKYSDFLVASFL